MFRIKGGWLRRVWLLWGLFGGGMCVWLRAGVVLAVTSR